VWVFGDVGPSFKLALSEKPRQWIVFAKTDDTNHY